MDNFISSYKLDTLQKLVNECNEILKYERSQRSKSLCYSANSLSGMQYEQHFEPSKYYSFTYFDKKISIVCDNYYINSTQKKEKSDSVFYHLIVSGFIPNLDCYHTRIDKLQIYKELVYGNFKTLDEAKLWFKRVVYQITDLKICKHWQNDTCEIVKL